MKILSKFLLLLVWNTANAFSDPAPIMASSGSPSEANAYTNEIFITNFKIDGSAQPIIPTPSRTVGYSLTMSKPHGYHGRVNVFLYFGDASGPALTTTANQITGARAIPPDIASFPSDGWTDGYNGRDYYDITVSHPSPGTGGVDTYFNTSTLSTPLSPTYTYVYAVAINTNSTTYADPNALRGVSAGIGIGLPCISDNFVQNVTISPSTKTYKAGQTLYVGRNVKANIPAGDVNVARDARAYFIARDAIILSEGVYVEGGIRDASFFLDATTCSESTFTSDSPPSEEALTSTNPSSTSFNEADSQSSLSKEEREPIAYPNPASETINLAPAVTNATLVNDQGHVVQRADNSGTLDVQSLPEGLYNLQMVQNGKLINQHIQVKH